MITIDAMGTQKKIAEKIAGKNADYMLALKGNQGILKDDVELYFEEIDEKKYDTQIVDYDKQVEKDYWRLEIRECWSTEKIQWGIENSLHWVLDMAFDEDHFRKRRRHPG